MQARWTRHARLLLIGSVVLVLMACAQGSTELYGWRALAPGMELRVEQESGLEGQKVLALLYTVATGQTYAVERQMPGSGWHGPPALRVFGKATRVLHVALVLVNKQGQEHESARTLLPGDWHELNFNSFNPPLDDWGQAVSMRFVDRTGELGGQGPVSLKLAGLPLQGQLP
jgi:hypothetical protein